jgi:hypothetical protein
MRTVADPARVRDLLQSSLVSRPGYLGVPGGAEPFEVVLDALPPPVGRPGPGALAARAEPGALAAVEWRKGLPVSVWFAQPAGIVGFRSQVVTFAADRLLLERPPAVVQYSRRAATRYAVRPDDPPAVLLPLAGGDWYRCRDVLDLSASGVGLVLPADLALPVRATTTAGLQLLRQDRPLMLNAVCRHTRPHGDGRVRYGLQFLDPPRTACLAIERYVRKMALRSLEEDCPPTMTFLPPPPAPGGAAVRQGR